MYKILIVDDEHMVRNGIRKLVPWEKYGFEICGEGEDGCDGLDKIKEMSPDIVFVDIKMPGMNGIDMIKAAKEAGFSGQFIILTGYADFDYAKSAITLGVQAYILKPIDENELIEQAKRAVELIEKRREAISKYETSKQKAYIETLRRLLINSEEEAELEELKQYSELTSHSLYCVAVIDCNIYDIQNEAESKLNIEKLDLLTANISDVEMICSDDMVILIFMDKTFNEVSDILYIQNEKVAEKYNEGFYITVGHSVSKIKNIRYSFECATYLKQKRFLYSKKEIITIKVLETTPKEYSDEEFPEVICKAIMHGDNEAITEKLNQYSNYLKDNLTEEADIKVLATNNAVTIRFIMINRYEIPAREMPDISRVIEGIKQVESLEEITKKALFYLLNLAEIVKKYRGGDDIVEKVKDYIEQNYAADLKLSDIAEMFHYNSSYLGRAFKAGTGKSFNTMLDEVRVRNAKRLLEETDYLIYEISDKVGFSNADYFTMKFKKYYGISAKDYKSKIKVHKI